MSNNFNKSGKKTSRKQPSVASDRSMKVGGKNPGTLKAESEKRLRLFEKVRKFYVNFTDGSRIKSGLGEIVEWTEHHNEDELNAKLKAKYKGFDLTSLKTLDEEDQKTKTLNQRLNQKKTLNLAQKSSKMTMSKILSLPSSKKMKNMEEVDPENASEKEIAGKKREEELRTKLTEFYRTNSKNFSEEQLDKVLEYGLKQGIGKLNLKLQKSFGVGKKIEMDDSVDSDEENPTSHVSTIGNPKSNASGSRVPSFSKLLLEVEKEKERTMKQSAKVVKPMASTRDLVASSIAPSTRRYVEAPIASTKRLPPQLRMFLKLYYAVYDPKYIVKRMISQVESQAKAKGYEKLDQALTTKYKESLGDFQARVENVQDKLHGFYLEVDIKRTNDSLMQVLQWTMRNGIPYLNTQLRKKYGVDLDSYKNNRAEPKPISGHDTDDFEPEF